MDLAYVFAYDNLASPESNIWDLLEDDPVYGRLSGFVRNWTPLTNVSPGQSGHYVDTHGNPFRGSIAHLSMAENPYSWVNGVALPVDLEALLEIGGEHAGRYQRSHDLSARFQAYLRGPVFALLPLEPEDEPDEVAISEQYWHQCQVTFTFLAEDGWQEFLLTTEISEYPRRHISLA